MALNKFFQEAGKCPKLEPHYPTHHGIEKKGANTQISKCKKNKNKYFNKKQKKESFEKPMKVEGIKANSDILTNNHD